ncbi:hypothetical protein GGTG_00391 [Gaeumannomyces tritici R3-111a-1]|uniref:Uncharacterized protein n=1 Tax=Gaeumannomyces tritici (strain R3-111a-1) TaxID=644352 RepID=J3NGK1_GAET3|nr:hypothetical protein GGTG_00391 [Gaeumannomyces tritici R3-111a-1]EJT80391.1 hypothetical protein GGTG_00391 [Gaeumannomyces tritici R3-111a-1]
MAASKGNGKDNGNDRQGAKSTVAFGRDPAGGTHTASTQLRCGNRGPLARAVSSGRWLRGEWCVVGT